MCQQGLLFDILHEHFIWIIFFFTSRKCFPIKSIGRLAIEFLVEKEPILIVLKIDHVWNSFSDSYV